jgi:HSP20 family protein
LKARRGNAETTMTKHHPEKPVELYRDDDAYVVIVDLPGFDREDIDVHWHDGRLHVEAEHLTTEAGRTQVVHRHLGLPRQIDVDGISATFEEDVLEVHLPIEGEGRPRGTSVDVE